MEAIRQIVKVKNNKISITLPENFNSEVVEVIILSSHDEKYNIPEQQIDQVGEQSSEYNKNPKIVLDFDETIKEVNTDFILTNEQINILDERAKQDSSKFITAEESLARLKRRHRV